MPADDWTEEKAKRLFGIAIALISVILLIEAHFTARAWLIAEASDARWQYPRYTAHLPEGCGRVLEMVVCVSTELVGR